MIAVHGRRGAVERNADGRELRIVGLDEADARAVHADAARDEVGSDRKGVTVAGFDAGDLAAAFEAGEELFEFALVVASRRRPRRLRSSSAFSGV